MVTQYRELYKVITEAGEELAQVSGKFSYEAPDRSAYPVVGDFVMLSPHSAGSGNAVIHKVLTRKSAFGRTAVGATDQTQLVAANVDVVFLCMSLNNDYNLSRLERYLSVAWSSGATPVILLTKSDLCPNLDGVLSDIASIAFGVDVITTASNQPESIQRLAGYLKKGVTASFIGSSGVGKTTLINCLAEKELLETGDIRRDDKGRHTTTRRELFVLPQGGIVIDTPGMRELGVEAVDLSKSFSDISALAEGCKFRDCSHQAEPGCAVQEAIDIGALDPRRLDNYRKLQKEARYDGLSARQIEAEKINAMFGGKSNMKQVRDFVKGKGRR